ncbi:MAG: nucleotidyltransferase substrate binding protein [Acinetobacter sp.]|nr:nucleotidyltransferase substrate binding protein [Acinetobacter sp.]
MKLNLSSLKLTLQLLDDALSVVNHQAWFTQQDEKVQQTLLAGVIQNFEFVYEISLKMIRRQLEQDADNPQTIDAASFRDILRMAGEKGWLADVEAWFHYRQMRNITSHTYDQQKAQQVYQAIATFQRDAQDLLDKLEQHHA